MPLARGSIACGGIACGGIVRGGIACGGIVRAAAVAAVALALAGCVDRETARKAIDAVAREQSRPDSMPRMRNAELPFRYPPALYERRVQGNVVLRIVIDSVGFVVPESTAVATSSGYPELDSAAVADARFLAFRPAWVGGRPAAVATLLPVYYRHPDAAPLPGDSVLRSPPPSAPRSP